MHKAKLLSSEGGKARHIFFRPTPKKTLQNQLLIRVSSNKKRSFCEKKNFLTISLHFRISFACKNCEISLESVLRKNARFSQNRECENFAKK